MQSAEATKQCLAELKTQLLILKRDLLFRLFSTASHSQIRHFTAVHETDCTVVKSADRIRIHSTLREKI